MDKIDKKLLFDFAAYIALNYDISINGDYVHYNGETLTDYNILVLRFLEHFNK